MVRFVLLLLLLFRTASLHGQSVADFSVKPSACRAESLELTNTSTNATFYQWDFCLEDILNFKSSTKIATVPGLSSGTHYKSVKSDEGWFAFVTSYETNTISRVTFSSLGVIESVVNLGNFGGLITEPYTIDIGYNNGQWYGFVGSLLTNHGVVKLKFGASLLNTPTASNIGSFGFTTNFIDLQILHQGTDAILSLIANGVTTSGDGSMVTVNFGSSLDNTPSGGDIFSVPVIEGGTTLRGFDLIQKNGNWLGLYSTTNGKIIKLEFGNDIQTATTGNSSYTFSGVNTPFDVSFLQEGSRYYGIVGNLSLPIAVVDFGTLTGEAPVELPTSSLPTVFSVVAIRTEGKTILQGSTLGNELYHIVFESPCTSTLAFSEEELPPSFSFTAFGTKEIELLAFSLTSEESVTSETVTVSADVAPDISFLTDGVICEGAPVTFQAQNSSNNIVSYTWSFGDTNTGTGAAPQHTYVAGSYAVRVDVLANNACVNFAKTSVIIYTAPVADFNLPSVSVFCTNQLYLFENTSLADPASPVAWKWFINSVEEADSEDLQFSFVQSSPQVITLKGSLPGCESEIMKNIPSLTVGPSADFTFSGHCQNQQITFTNSSSGAISGYSWDFDDGINVVAENVSHAFAAAGNHLVTLTVNSSSGCNNNVSKNIPVFSKPAVNFKAEAPPASCNGTPTPFTDLTPQPTDSQLQGWQWNFGDPGLNNTSAIKNPSHTFSNAGDYLVSVTITTDMGCAENLQKTITISPSPTAGITNSPTCLAVPVNFLATGSDIKSYYWEMGTLYYEVANPVHTFNAAGNQSVKLTIQGNNNCITVYNRPITVPVVLSPDFSVIDNCTGHEAVFTDITTGADPVVQRTWDFAGLGTSSGQPASFGFTSTGNKNIKLTVTTQAGCLYTKNRMISVVAPPVAAFTASPESGGTPLFVQFTNTSVGATNYTWSIDEGSIFTTNQVSPSYTFTQAGSFLVTLAASGPQGCASLIAKEINTTAGLPDVDLKLITTTENADGTTKVIITVQNKGNTILRNLPVVIDISGRVSLTETIAGPIGIASMYNLILSYGLIPDDDLKFLCAKATLENDQTPEGNRICKEFNDGVFLFNAYPNPAKGELTIEWIAPKDEAITISLVDSSGKKIVLSEVSSLEGLNSSRLSLDNIKNGLYILRIQGASLLKTQRIFVSGQN